MKGAVALSNDIYDENIGGYKLNTDFNEIKTDFGRMFEFVYGSKENGAVSAHMAVMYLIMNRSLIKIIFLK